MVPRTLTDWFTAHLDGTGLAPPTKAYVVSVMAGMAPSGTFGPGESVVLAYAEARSAHDFVRFQRIGDWVLWVEVWAPAYVARDHRVVESIGRLSYATCHRILRGTWPIYEELADRLPAIVTELRAVR